MTEKKSVEKPGQAAWRDQLRAVADHPEHTIARKKVEQRMAKLKDKHGYHAEVEFARLEGEVERLRIAEAQERAARQERKITLADIRRLEKQYQQAIERKNPGMICAAEGRLEDARIALRQQGRT